MLPDSCACSTLYLVTLIHSKSILLLSRMEIKYLQLAIVCLQNTFSQVIETASIIKHVHGVIAMVLQKNLSDLAIIIVPNLVT